MRIEERAGWGLTAIGLIGATMALMTVFGCSSTRKLVEALPPGTSFQSSQTGVQFSPESMSPLNFGNSFIALQLLPPDNGVAINRSNIRASLSGVENTSTVTVGPVGEQIEKAGGAEAIEALLRSRVGSRGSISTEGPRNEPDSEEAD